MQINLACKVKKIHQIVFTLSELIFLHLCFGCPNNYPIDSTPRFESSGQSERTSRRTPSRETAIDVILPLIIYDVDR